MKNPASALCLAAFALIPATGFGATTLYNHSFTQAEGFTDAGLTGQNGFVAQAQWNVTNSAGTGEVTAAAPAFGRFTADGDHFNWTTIGIGDVLELKITDLSMLSSSGTSHQLATLGLTTLTLTDGENPGGNGNSQLGGQLTTNGTNYFLDEGAFGISGGATDTGIALGTLVTYTVSITKTGATTADITQSLELSGGGGLVTHTDLNRTDAGNANNVGGTPNLDDKVAGIWQAQNANVGATSVGSFSGVHIPEPSAALLFGASLLVGLRRRR